jgi:hypothetical protein
MKHLCTVVTLAMALGIMLVSTGLVGSTLAQTNTTSNAAGNTTGAAAQNTTGNQSGVETSSEIESLTQGNPQLLTNSTDVTDKTTGLADLQKEQTTTDPNMTTATK